MILILTILIAITIHEFGHAFKAKKFGLEINSINIGLSFKLFSFQIPQFPNTPIHIRLLPLGGWVSYNNRVDSEDIEFRKNIAISGAGITLNLVCAMICVIGLILATAIDTKTITLSIGVLLLIFILLKYETYFHMYVSPFIGLIMTITVFYLLFQRLSKTEDTQTLVNTATEINATGADLNGILIIVFGINIILALLNTMILMPLDGGHIVKAWLKRKHIPTQNYIKYSQYLFFIVFILDWFGASIKSFLNNLF